MEASNYRARSLPGAALTRPNSLPFADIDDAHPLAHAIVDTIRDPLLVLDQDLRVVTANRAFHETFRINRQDIQGRRVDTLGDGQWDIPEASGISPNFGCCWRTSRHSMP
jgi:PAS domain-containing protein